MKEKKQIMTGIVTVKNKHLLYFLLVIYLFGGTSAIYMLNVKQKMKHLIREKS